MRIINVVGARPNFVKIAPLMEAYKGHPSIEPVLVHTGQHYDRRMSGQFFQQLGIAPPRVNLGVGSASHALQTSAIMAAFEPVVVEYRPDAVLVVGDVNSTIACGLVASKLGVKLIHVEAGLRSFDRTMPEEINRVLTDAISDLLFCTEASGVRNLRNEGIADGRAFLVGNVMIDSLLRCRARAEASTILDRLALRVRAYAVLTLHRPNNVDDPMVLGRILSAVETIQRDLPVVFPVHPRTRKNLAVPALSALVARAGDLKLVDALGYLDFVKLISSARVVLTDSGGIQEETTILKVPCLTLRENTERPVTVEAGSNRIVGTEPSRILSGYRSAINGDGRPTRTPPLWDGHAAERIVTILARTL